VALDGHDCDMVAYIRRVAPKQHKACAIARTVCIGGHKRDTVYRRSQRDTLNAVIHHESAIGLIWADELSTHKFCAVREHGQRFDSGIGFAGHDQTGNLKVESHRPLIDALIAPDAMLSLKRDQPAVITCMSDRFGISQRFSAHSFPSEIKQVSGRNRIYVC